MDLLKLPGNATAPSPTTSSDLPTIDLQVWTTDLAVVSSVVSSLGSFAILYFFLKYSDMRTTSREILAYISLSDIIGNAMVIWGVLWTSAHHSNVSSDNIQCQVQATLLICVGIAEYLWTCALAFYLFVIIVRESAWGNARCPNVVHAVCWGCGFVVAAFAYGFGKTGVDVQARNTAQWCILRDAKDPKIGGDQAYIMWSFLVGDGWSFLAIICTITFYVIIKYHIYKEKTNRGTSFMVTRSAMSAASTVDRKLTWIPIIYFLLHIWGPMRTIFSLSSTNDSRSLSPGQQVLLALETFGDCSEGLTNGVIFILFSPKLRQRIKSFLALCLYRCCARLRPQKRRQSSNPRVPQSEQSRLIRGTIKSTYAQESDSQSHSRGQETGDASVQAKRFNPNLTGLGNQLGERDVADDDDGEMTMSVNTERKSFAI